MAGAAPQRPSPCRARRHRQNRRRSEIAPIDSADPVTGDAESRFNVLPRDLRLERRAGASIGDIQIARARSYVARLEAELADDAPALSASDRQRKQRTLDEWRAHLTALHADAARNGMHDEVAPGHAAE